MWRADRDSGQGEVHNWNPQLPGNVPGWAGMYLDDQGILIYMNVDLQIMS